MDGATCLITGCALFFVDSEAFCWGDLHEFEGLWIFNATTDPRGDAVFYPMTDALPTFSEKVIFVRSSTKITEKRGILILRADQDLLNPAAAAYVTGINHPKGI